MLSRRAVATVAVCVLVAACSHNPKPAAPQPAPTAPAQPPAPQPPLPQPPAAPQPPSPPARSAVPALVPLPAMVEPGGGAGFTITSETTIVIGSASAAMQSRGRELAEFIRRATGSTPPVLLNPSAPPQRGVI